MKTLMSVTVLAAGSILSADVVTSVTCNIPGLSVTDPHSCYLQGPPQPVGGINSAYATASASFSLAADPNSYSSLSTNQSTSATAAEYQNLSDAISRVSVNETLFTTGNVRPGIVQVIVSGGSDYFYGNGQMDLSLGPASVTCPGNRFALTGCVLRAVPNPFPSQEYSVPLYPESLQEELAFTLGQPFRFSFSGLSSGNGTTYASGGGDAIMQFQFRFLEADGVTPVAMEAVPEPGTFAFSGVALGVLIASKRKLRGCFDGRHRYSESEQ